MTALAIIAVCVVAAIALVGLMVRLAQRQGRALARVTAKADAQAEVIKALTIQEEIEDAVNADPDLVGRSVRWVRPSPE